MAGLNEYDCEGTLTIGGESMNRLAWAILGDDTGRGGLLPLWITTDQRGEDRIVPSSAGVVAYQRRETVTRHDLRLIVTGDVDESGVATANAYQGLLSNLDYIESNVVSPTGLTDGTRAATLAMPGQTSRTADIHILQLIARQYYVSDTQALFEGTLKISIPAGRFT